LTITKDYKVEVSRKIREVFENGKEYYRFHGNNLQVLPENRLNQPHEDYIEWHNENVFNG
jgi:putative restriction endonuclease